MVDLQIFLYNIISTSQSNKTWSKQTYHNTPISTLLYIIKGCWVKKVSVLKMHEASYAQTH